MKYLDNGMPELPKGYFWELKDVSRSMDGRVRVVLNKKIGPFSLSIIWGDALPSGSDITDVAYRIYVKRFGIPEFKGLKELYEKSSSDGK